MSVSCSYRYCEVTLSHTHAMGYIYIARYLSATIRLYADGGIRAIIEGNCFKINFVQGTRNVLFSYHGTARYHVNDISLSELRGVDD